jgi:hypothetical protein
MRISKDLENHVIDVMANVDDGDFSEEEEGDEFQDGMVNRSRFQAKLITMAKTEFGLLPRTSANKLMVRKFLRDAMREHGMRPSHILQHLDVSVACFFIPSSQDILAHQLGATREAHNRDGLISMMWESYFGPLGRMLGFSSQ